ncbi:MAG TPA: SLC13 family permease [Gemmatimonadales bacterium]
MSRDILLVFGITMGALGLFIWNRLRVDVVGLVVMAALIVTGLLTVRDGTSGFANEAMLTVAAMFVLSAGLVRTGAVDALGRQIARLAAGTEFGLLVVSIAFVIPLSALMNNTPVIVVMLPLVLGISREIQVAPSRILMPLSFAGQMGGTLTLIGTSTNLLVAGLVLDLGLDRIRLFDITPPALVLTAIGVGYLLTIGRWLTPTRAPAADLIEAYELRDYLSVLRVTDGSRLTGRSLGEIRFAKEYGLQVVAIERDGGKIHAPGASTVIRAGDYLLVEGTIKDIAAVEDAAGVEIRRPVEQIGLPGTQPEEVERAAAGATASEGDRPEGDREDTAKVPEVKLAELLVPPRSTVIGRTLRQLHFRTRFGVSVLGITRHGTSLTERMRDVVLEIGDLLLVEGTPEALRAVHEGRILALLGAVELPARRIRKLPLAVGIMTAVVAVAAVGIVPILVSALVGAIAMFVTGCVTPEEAYEDVDWMVLVLLGSIIPLGLALQQTGAAELIAVHVVTVSKPLGPYGVLAAFFLLTAALTSVLSNNAAAVVLTPIAIATAAGLDAAPMPFVIAVMIAASNSYMTPIGYQTNTFIFGPGGYEFRDFVRVGGPLNLVMVVAAAFVIPIFFPFHP